MLAFKTISASVCSISAQALQENVTPLLGLLRESVQLNLAPPGHFLLLGSVLIFVLITMSVLQCLNMSSGGRRQICLE